jgi:hypothetical protein
MAQTPFLSNRERAFEAGYALTTAVNRTAKTAEERMMLITERIQARRAILINGLVNGEMGS